MRTNLNIPPFKKGDKVITESLRFSNRILTVNVCYEAGGIWYIVVEDENDGSSSVLACSTYFKLINDRKSRIEKFNSGEL